LLLHLQVCCGLPLLRLLPLLLVSDWQPAAHLLQSGARLGLYCGSRHNSTRELM
jgi:hypothetical protein